MKRTKNNNLEIRKELEKTGMYYWEFAELLNISPSVLSVKLRKEWSQAEKNTAVLLIRERVQNIQ